MQRINRQWRRVPVVIRKPLILIIGSTVVIVGLALLLLPGPGWLIIFLGFAILSSEFVIAEKIQKGLVRQLGLIVAYLRKKLRLNKKK